MAVRVSASWKRCGVDTGALRAVVRGDAQGERHDAREDAPARGGHRGAGHARHGGRDRADDRRWGGPARPASPRGQPEPDGHGDHTAQRCAGTLHPKGTLSLMAMATMPHSSARKPCIARNPDGKSGFDLLSCKYESLSHTAHQPPGMHVLTHAGAWAARLLPPVLAVAASLLHIYVNPEPWLHAHMWGACAARPLPPALARPSVPEQRQAGGPTVATSHFYQARVPCSHGSESALL